MGVRVTMMFRTARAAVALHDFERQSVPRIAAARFVS